MMYAEDKGLASLKRQYKIISPRQRPRHTPSKELVLELPLPRHEIVPWDHDVEAQESSKEQGEVIINLDEEDDPCVIRNAF
jgi:hypothetical protein|tara:strand:- start:13 stop:255 length:243 start_codon:yes stop_codon:yes gene_type:complete